MWSQTNTPSQPASSASAASSASRRGSLRSSKGARVIPRLGCRRRPVDRSVALLVPGRRIRVPRPSLASRCMALNVYLSGEIHTDWRERIERGAAEAGLDVEFGAPVTEHAASDAAGVAILGEP